MTTKKKGRPVSAITRDAGLEVRVTAVEKAAFAEAAAITGIGMSAWARQTLRRAAARELEEAGRVAAFLVPRK
jgi:uncharacterized protein (DUF1778 family)